MCFAKWLFRVVLCVSEAVVQIGAAGPFKMAAAGDENLVFLSFWRRDPVLELQFPTPLRGSIVF